MKIYELLDSPEKWTQGQMARNAEGRPALYHSDMASCWCIEGAIQKCYGNVFTDGWDAVVSKIRDRIGRQVVFEWNDDPKRTYSDVIALCKELDI